VRRFTLNVQSLLQKGTSPAKTPPIKTFNFSQDSSSPEGSPNLSPNKFPIDSSLELTSFSKTSLDNFDLDDIKSPGKQKEKGNSRGSLKKEEKSSPGLRVFRRFTTMFNPSLSGINEEEPKKPVFERPKGTLIGRI